MPSKDSPEVQRVLGLKGSAVPSLGERSDNEYREIEYKYRSLFENVPAGLACCQMLFDAKGRPEDFIYLEVNESFQRMTQLRNVAGRKASEVIPNIQRDDAELLAIYGRVALSGKAERFEFLFKSLNMWFDITAFCPKEGHFMTVFDVITERKQMETNLFESKEMLRRIIDNIPQHVFWKDRDSKFLGCNMTYARMAGLSHPKDIIGKSVLDLPWKADTKRFRDDDRQVMETRCPKLNYEEALPRPDGNTKVIRTSKMPLRDREGQVIGVLGIFEDITELKKLEEQLMQAQKMESFGQLAGGIAHDFNNILAAMVMRVQLMQEDSAESKKICADLKDIETDIQRAVSLTRQLLLFSRKQAIHLQIIDLNAVLANLLKMLQRILGEHISVRFANNNAPLWVEADAGMIEQVVMNLCVNARDAMPQGGSLTIDTQLQDLIAPSVAKQSRPSRFIRLTVSDTGCGMDGATLKRIFEPFFTTKEIGKGTGLGLSTAYSVVKQHGGWITAESVLGQGSSFHVHLPAVDAKLEPPSNIIVAQDIRGGSESILLVEDESAVRTLVAMCLQQAGYTVVEAANGVEALQIWETQNSTFDLLLTDMMMPGGISGAQLAEQLVRAKSTLKVIITSGYHAHLDGSKSPTPLIGTFLAKPADRQKLLKTVRRCLDGT